MQIIDPTVFAALLVVAAVASVVGLVLSGRLLVAGLSVTRRERIARHQSIPSYYGRLQFAR